MARTLDTPPLKRRRKAGAVIVLLLMLGSAWLGLNLVPPAYLLADYRTGVGEERTIELPDHSRVTLNTYSAIDVQFNDSQRRILLRQGEILVEVARDRSRPFVVATPQGTARALGTRYLVRRDAGVTTVTVLKSHVEACIDAGHKVRRDSLTCVALHAGQRTRITADAVEAATNLDAYAESAWMQGRLAVDNRPLTEVLAELERYRTGRIRFDAAQLAPLRVSGVFPLADTDHALTALEASLPIRVSQHPLLVIVKPR